MASENSHKTTNEGILLILSGPAGSGKTTLCERLLQDHPNLERAITATTRAPRPGEKDGKDYFFLQKKEFEDRKNQGDFLEWALVHGRAYGTLKEEILARMAKGKDVLLNIDVQGMLQIRRKQESDSRLHERLATVFLMPQDLDELAQRLIERNTDSTEEIYKRLMTAEKEIRQSHEFDYILTSGNKEEDYDRIRSIYLAEKMRNRLTDRLHQVKPL